MRFRNKGKAVQIRLKEKGGYRFELVWPGEIIDLPEEVGLTHRFEKVEGVQKSPTVTKGKIGKKTVETKQFDSERDYRRELVNIKGISRKRAEDIMAAFPTREDLIKAILEDKKLPFRDDIENSLKKQFLKKEESYN